VDEHCGKFRAIDQEFQVLLVSLGEEVFFLILLLRESDLLEHFTGYFLALDVNIASLLRVLKAFLDLQEVLDTSVDKLV